MHDLKEWCYNNSSYIKVMKFCGPNKFYLTLTNVKTE